MACFIVPAVEAIVTTVVSKVVKSKEKCPHRIETHLEGSTHGTAEKLPFSQKLKWLSNLLWGGSALLAFEHVWHGEVEPWFPFLTAASNPVDAMQMLREMATTGVGMALVVTAVWVGMLAVSSVIEKRALKSHPSEG